MAATNNTPTQFVITSKGGVALSTPTLSGVITVLGVDSDATCNYTLSAGTLEKSTNGGTVWSSVPNVGTVVLNDKLRITLSSSASNNTTTSATLTIQGISASFVVGTGSAIGTLTLQGVPFDSNSTKFSSRTGANRSNIIANAAIYVDFNGLTQGQSVVNTINDPGSVAGKRFSSALSNLGFAGGYGIQGSTAVKMPNKTSSCAVSIKAGSDGNQGGTTGAGTGSWGGSVAFPTPIPEGGELWYGQRIFIPTGFSWAGVAPATQDMIKFMRLNTSKLVGRIEHYVVNNSFGGGSGPYAEQKGWLLANEFDTITQTEVGKKSPGTLPLGQWCWVEFYIKASADRNVATRRLWVDGTLIFEYVGPAAKYLNSGGTYSTATLSHGIKTLSDNTDTIIDVMHGTYWNGNAPQDQTYYIQKIVGTANPAIVTAVDAFGNKMMGVQ